ncbi:MAG: hypothetical protein ABW321_04175 [Polyangiales bacterium]
MTTIRVATLPFITASCLLWLAGACANGTDSEPFSADAAPPDASTPDVAPPEPQGSDAAGAAAPTTPEPSSEAPDAAAPSGDAAADPGEVAQPSPAADGCGRGVIEGDLVTPTPDGGNVPVTELQVPPGRYVVSTTYLQLRQDDAGRARFGELMVPIMAELASRPGLVGVSLSTSRSCGTARTLSVWEDDAAMLGFVTSEAHLAAMGAVTEVSRGGSLVTHWEGDETTVSWQSAADHAGAAEGPFY